MEMLYVAIFFFLFFAFIFYVLRKAEKNRKRFILEAEQKRRQELEEVERQLQIRDQQRLDARNNTIAEYDEKYGNKNTIICEVKGVFARTESAKEEAESLNPGERVSLKHEPTNKYDEFAIKVISEKKHIGYIPKEYSEEVFHQIKKDNGYHAIVLQCYPSYDDYHDDEDVYIELKLYPKDYK